MNDKKKGVILFAHGSPDPGWKIPFVNIEQKLRGKLGEDYMVATAFLQYCEPDIFMVADEMCLAGRDEVTVAPIFLAAGNHVTKDFPRIGKSLEEKYPGVTFEWTEAIGQWAEAQEALARVIHEVVLRGAI